MVYVTVFPATKHNKQSNDVIVGIIDNLPLFVCFNLCFSGFWYLLSKQVSISINTDVSDALLNCKVFQRHFEILIVFFRYKTNI